MLIRRIIPSDIPALFLVRTATDQNRLSRAELTSLGITEATVLQKLQTTHRGWLSEIDGQVVGFAMGDGATGELWVIAVLPAFIRRGIGSMLMIRSEEWLWAQGCASLWLTTAADRTLRAYSFYRRHGWEEWKTESGLLYMKKTRAP